VIHESQTEERHQKRGEEEGDKKAWKSITRGGAERRETKKMGFARKSTRSRRVWDILIEKGKKGGCPLRERGGKNRGAEKRRIIMPVC